MFQCSENRVGQIHNPYWEHVHNTLKSPGALRIIGEYFMGVDLSGFAMRSFPLNDYQKEMIEISRQPWLEFYNQWDGERTGARDLFNQFRSYCNTVNVMCTSESGFFKKLCTKLNRGLEKVKSNGCMYYEKHLLPSPTLPLPSPDPPHDINIS